MEVPWREMGQRVYIFLQERKRCPFSLNYLYFIFLKYINSLEVGKIEQKSLMDGTKIPWEHTRYV